MANIDKDERKSSDPVSMSPSLSPIQFWHMSFQSNSSNTELTLLISCKSWWNNSHLSVFKYDAILMVSQWTPEGFALLVGIRCTWSTLDCSSSFGFNWLWFDSICLPHGSNLPFSKWIFLFKFHPCGSFWSDYDWVNE